MAVIDYHGVVAPSSRLVGCFESYSISCRGLAATGLVGCAEPYSISCRGLTAAGDTLTGCTANTLGIHKPDKASKVDGHWGSLGLM